MSKILHINCLNSSAIVGSLPSCTRTGSATRYNSSGDMVDVAINTIRENYTLGGVARGWMHEPASENRVTHAEDFTQWTNIGSNDVANEGDGPRGAATMTRIEGSGGGSGTCYIQRSVTFDASVVHQVTAYLRKGSLTWAYVAVPQLAGVFANAYFDLDNEVVGNLGTDVISAEIMESESGLLRCRFSFLNGTDTAGSVRVHAAAGNGNTTVTRDSDQYIYAAAVQIEPDIDYATSFIPTTGAAVTRGVESITHSSFTGDIRTMYVEAVRDIDKASVSSGNALNANDGGTTNRVLISATTTAGDAQAVVTAAGSNVYAQSDSGVDFLDAGVHRVAVRVVTNDFIHYADGNAGSADVVGAASTGINTLVVGDDHNGGDTFAGHIRGYAIWDEGLDNTELNEITTNGVSLASISPFIGDLVSDLVYDLVSDHIA